jgi:hypothetical protein
MNQLNLESSASKSLIKLVRPKEHERVLYNPLIKETQKYVEDLKKFNQGKIQKYKMELINMKLRSNISHSGISKEMRKIEHKLSTSQNVLNDKNELPESRR